MNTTTTPDHATETEHTDPDSAAGTDWEGYLAVRTDLAGSLLDDLTDALETVKPGDREHAADLLDSAIEILERLTKRFPPPRTEPAPPNPPF